jgi:transposase
MWTGWWSGTSCPPPAPHLRGALFSHAAHVPPQNTALKQTIARGRGVFHVRSAVSVLCTTQILLRQHGGDHIDVPRGSSPSTPSAQKTLAPSNISSSASAATTTATATDQRTAELLRAIARRGGAAGRRPQPDVAETLFSANTAPTRQQKGVSRGQKGDSRRATVPPLARLFAAPPSTDKESGKKRRVGRQQQHPSPPAVSATVSSAAATAATPGACHHSRHPQRTDDMPTFPPPLTSPPPSRALLSKLLYTIQQEKRVSWDVVVRDHPEVAQMPLFACRDDWTAQMLQHGSAASLTRTVTSSAVQPIFLCAAATGTGKSVLLPLFALDAHWAALECRLQRTLATYDTLITASGTTNDGLAHAAVESCGAPADTPSCEVPPFPLTSQADFIQEFKSCSQLCLVVSQPTRVACVELARYVCTLLHAQDRPRQAPTAASSFSSTEDRSSSAGGAGTAHAEVYQQLLGKRVGYAVGGEPRFCAATELIYATPAYVLNALQLAGPRPTAEEAAGASPLVPTTLMVDEAHCRDIETDALLAWVKLSRRRCAAATSGKRSAIRQYFVMSATMCLTAMDRYLSRPLPSGASVRDEAVGGRGACASAAVEPPPLLLLSPAQRQCVEQWWLASTHAASASSLQQHHHPQQRRQAPQGQENKKVMGHWTTQMQHDPQARSAVLQCIEATEGESYDAGNGVATLACDGAQLSSRVGRDDSMPQGIVVSTTPYRVERFFVEDLDPQRGCFDQSCILFDRDTRRAAAADKASRDSHGAPRAAVPSPASCMFQHLPLCLTDEGRALRRHLVQLYSTRASSYNMFANQSRLLASFVVEVMQAARLRWVAPSLLSHNASGLAAAEPTSSLRFPAHPSVDGGMPTSAPVTILFFVAGFSEMHQLMQALERLCEKVQTTSQLPVSPPSGAVAAESGQSVASTPVEVFRSGDEIFSVGLLHASAVGSPQEQLTATERAGAPLRLLLATNVAESSLTIPNTRIVIDTCLERRVVAEEMTGTTTVRTAFASPSSLRQRCGRVGRTADGIAIHLAPRHYVLPPAPRPHEVLEPQSQPQQQRVAQVFRPTRKEEYVWRTPQLEPLVDGVVTVLLHMKSLFADVAAALAALPSPPAAWELRVALQQLVDMDVLVLPTETAPAAQRAFKAGEGSREKGEARRCGVASVHRHSNKREGSSIAEAAVASLDSLLNDSRFTAKGRLIASLPLPYEHAALVHHAFQFLCVEDAVLLACAMSVPTLFTTPRITAHSAFHVAQQRPVASSFTWSHRNGADATPALSPLEYFYQRVCVQRELAGFSSPINSRSSSSSYTPHTHAGDAQGKSNESGQMSADSAGGSDHRVGHLSEPLLLRTIMRRWYALPSLAEAGSLLTSLAVNRATLRQVDGMVDQCCTRLIHLLLRSDSRAEAERSAASSPDSLQRTQRCGLDDGAEKDLGAYLCEASPSWTGEALPFVGEWPEGVQEQLVRSLRRLQRAAHSRVHLRQTTNRLRSGLPQWHDGEEQCIRLCSQPYVHRVATHHRWRRATLPRDGGEGRVEVERGGDELEAKEQQQRELAVRHHPSFAYWGQPPRPRSAQSHWTHHGSVVSTSTTTTTLAYPSSAVEPPPIHASLTRARSPVYRPPPPPPALPPVAFVLGRTEDRLCAAFVAAFGHRTMRGEDGGHRFHHRRLIRNMQTLQHDADHVCTFHIELQSSPAATPVAAAEKEKEEVTKMNAAGDCDGSGGDGVTRRQRSTTPLTTAPMPLSRATAASHEDLVAADVTPDVIRRTLEPYLAGAGLQQLEVFQSNQLAVAARFASNGFTSLFAETSTSAAASAAGDQEDNDGGGGGAGEDGEEGGGGAIACGMTDTPPTAVDSRTVQISATTTKSATQCDGEGCGGVPSSNDESGTWSLLQPAPLSHVKRTSAAVTPHCASHRHRAPDAESGGLGNPYVQLAPFGVSLLVAAVSGGSGGIAGLGGLQRIPLLPTPAQTQEAYNLNVTPAKKSCVTVDSKSAASAAEMADTSAAASTTVIASTRPLPQADARRGLRFSETPANDVTVSWADIFGRCSRAVRRSDVAALALDDLFPSPPPPPSSAVETPTATAAAATELCSAASAGDAGVGREEGSVDDGNPPLGKAASEPHQPPPHAGALTLSVLPPVYITRSITWKVPLPVSIALPHRREEGEEERRVVVESAGGLRSGALARARRQPPLPRTPLRYCVVCQHLCQSHSRFQQHCRSASHLDHLYHAVQLGLGRAQLQQVYGYPLSASPPPLGGGLQGGQGKESNATSATMSSAERRSDDGDSSATARGIRRFAPSAPASASALPTLTTAAMPLLSLLSLDSASGREALVASPPPSSPAAADVHRRRLLTQQLHPCTINPLSFLNCLQWTTRNSAAAAASPASPSTSSTPRSSPTGEPAGGDTVGVSASDVSAACTSAVMAAENEGGSADRATPLAVAGSLVSMQASADILPPLHLRTHASLSACAPSPSTAISASAACITMQDEPEPHSNLRSGAAAAAPSSPATVAASTLSAHHVWVLDVSSSSTSAPPPYTTSSSRSSRTPPMSLLFVIAGYLAAATPQAMVALLFNATHTHLHGVMLYGLGTWRLPEPLAMEAYAGVLEHMGRGGGWPGLLIPLRDNPPPQPTQPSQGIHEGLHWCTPTGSCKMGASTETTVLGRTRGASTSNAARTTSSGAVAKVAEEELKQLWPTVEATLLLTLHEYLQARRNMVTLADYVERVLRKLQLSPFITTAIAAGADDGATAAATTTTPSVACSSSSSGRRPSRRVTPACLLADFMAHARGGQGIQSLLRDVGCVFITPPHALAALLLHTDAPADNEEPEVLRKDSPSSHTSRGWGVGASLTAASHRPTSHVRDPLDSPAVSSSSSPWSRRLSQRALSAEGAAVEVMFTVPPVLPSVLPPVDFAERLRSFYTSRHTLRWCTARAASPLARGRGTAAAGVSSRVARPRSGSGAWDDRLLF